MRQRSIAEFCFRHNGSQPSTARHGRALAEDDAAPPSTSIAPTEAWLSQRTTTVVTSGATSPADVHFIGADYAGLHAQQESPQSIASSSPTLYNPNVGLQLCTSSCTVTALLWPCLQVTERQALQSACYFINSDLRWYIKDLLAVNTSQSIAEAAEREHRTDDETISVDSESHAVYSTLPRKAG